jgi:predicted transcriptional regulator
MVVPEHALEGTKEIAEYLCLSPSTVACHYLPRMKKAGIIFSRLRGQIPHRQKKIYTFPSLILKFLQMEKKI